MDISYELFFLSKVQFYLKWQLGTPDEFQLNCAATRGLIITILMYEPFVNTKSNSFRNRNAFCCESLEWNFMLL